MTRPERGAIREITTALRFIWNHPANRGKRARKLAEALAFQARGRLFGKPSIARIGERSRVIVHPGHGQAGLLYANPTEWPEIQCWRRNLHAGDLFVDLGANVGAYTLWAIELGAEVVAVEPNGWAAGQLERNLELNGYTARVIRAAVADAPGRSRFTTDLGVLNHLITSESGARTEEVEVTTLDEILGDRSAAGVKVDVEGAEMLVLRGAERAITEKRIGLMQLEWNPCSDMHFGEDRATMAEFVRARGYGLFRPDHDGVLRPLEHLAPGPDVFAKPVGTGSGYFRQGD